MSAQANPFKLGLFVIVATALLITGLIALGAGAFLKRTVIIETYFVESVQGLDVGADVKHRGVRLGRVSRIGFVYQRYPIPENASQQERILRSLVLVDMELDANSELAERLLERRDAAVDAGLRARLSSAGLMGVVFIELSFLDPQRNPPPAIDWTPVLPYVPSARSVMGTITDTVQRIADAIDELDISTLAKRVDDFVTRLDEKLRALDVVSMQTDARALIEELRGSNRRLRTILDAPEIELVLGDLAQTTGTIRRIADERGSDVERFLAELPKVTDSAQQTIARAQAFLDDPALRLAIDGLAATTEATAPAAAEARVLLRRMNTLIAGQQQDLEAIIIALRRVLEGAGVIVDDATRNPSRVLFGDPPPRVNPTETGAQPRRPGGSGVRP